MGESVNTTSRVSVGVAACVLVATAAFHGSGYPGAVAAAATPGVSPFFARAIPGIWLFFSWHLIGVAGALIWAAVRASRPARPLVVFCSVLVVADTVFVFTLAGMFAGTILLAIAAGLTVMAAVRWSDDRQV